MRTTIVGFALGAVLAAGAVFLVMRKSAEPRLEDTAVISAPVQPETPAPAVEKPSPAPPPEQVEQPVREPVRRERVPGNRPRRNQPATQPEAPVAKPTETPAPTIPVEQPAPVPETPVQTAQQPAKEAPPPEPRKPNTVTVAAGTLISARLGQTISSNREQTGDNFFATLDQPLVVDSFVVAERGARLEGKVVSAEQAGRVKGRSSLSIHLTRLTTADGQKIEIDTDPWAKQAESSVGRDAAKVGAASAIGAAIGAIAGGGKGAAIGAGVGAGAGTGGVMATRGKAVEIPVETRISFKLNAPVTITERLK